MCGRYVLHEDHTGIYPRFYLWTEKTRQEWDELFKAGKVLPVEKNYHVRPTNQVPVITNRDGERRTEMMRWGLIPSWYDPTKHATLVRSTFNARDDNLTSGMWRGPASRSRCLIPANGFYEWPKKGGLPAYIYPEDGRLIAFAGLFDTWQNRETGELVTSCSIVTTETNDFMRPLHWNPERKRMPVVLLGDEAETLWLDPLTTDPNSLKQFFGPLPWDGWTSHLVNKLPNDGKDNPSLIEQSNQSPRT